MSDRTFSVILLPTAECNVACDYCFEFKEPHRLSLESLRGEKGYELRALLRARAAS